MKRNGSWGGLLLVVLVGGAFSYVFLTRNQEKRYSEILVSLRPGQEEAALHGIARAHGFTAKPHKFAVGPNEFTRKHRIFSVRKYDLDPQSVNRVSAALSALGGAGGAGGPAATVEPNFFVHASKAPSDPLYAKQWNLRRIEVEKLWEKADGSGVTVAVIDTGVSRKLADLDKSRFVKGYNFITRDDDYEDDHGHGSHVAGTIAQDTGNGIGVAGIAPKAKIMPLKVLSAQGGGSTLGIAEAIVYAADNGANVINLSLGGGGYTQVLKDACDYAHKKGVIVVAAAGNEGQPASSFPARYENVLSVAAAGENDALAPYSNYGEGVDLVAPGGDTSSSPQGGILQNGPEVIGADRPNELLGGARYYYFQGTSMAAPHIAGIAALLYQTGVRGPDELRALLTRTGDKPVRGIPFVNPVAALAAKGSAVPPAAGKAPASRAPGEGPVQSFNAGAVTTTPQAAGIVLGVALFFAMAFAFLRKKPGGMDHVASPLLLLGLVMGATGLSFLGFLQTHAPFTALPERVRGLLFNSVLDYDRVLFFLSKPSLFWHNLFVPLGFMVLLNFASETARRFTIGLLLGMSAKLVCEGLLVRELTVLPDGVAASAWLVISGLVVFLFPFILARK